MEMKKALRQQQNEINDYALYSAFASMEKDVHNKSVYARIAREEKEHYMFWEKITGKKVEPNRWLIKWYMLLAMLLGTSFALKLAERREKEAQNLYRS
ncbi:MAG TPA: rubrerythrin family protein, partial [Campylobacterales bacterium]|nr:rubrerythrin family protein [Campylobacterales bacterium]